MEKTGRMGTVRFSRKLVKTEIRKKQRKTASIEKALAGASVGQTITIPVNGRTSISRAGRGWSCQVFDLSNTYVFVSIPSGRLKARVERIQPYPMTETVKVTGRLTLKTAERIGMTVTAVGD